MSLLKFFSRHVVVLSLLVLATACNANSQVQSEDTITRTKTQLKLSKQVVALGTLTPKGEVIKLSIANAQDSRVDRILVEEGDRVKQNQVIAILQGLENRQRDLEAAEKEVELAQAKLAQVKAGETKQAEIAAQQANISRLESQLHNETAERQATITSAKAQLTQAQLTFNRNQSLQRQGAVSNQAFDQAQESLDLAKANLQERLAQLGNTQQTLRQEINQERGNLAQLQEVRPVDVRVADIEVEKAMIAVEKIKADLEDTKVKVPISGQILRINTRVGEQVNTNEGIVELGRTDQMYAIAEVYETDISKVKIGQSATVSSEYGGFAGKLTGKVEHLGLQVGGKKLTESSEDPTQCASSQERSPLKNYELLILRIFLIN